MQDENEITGHWEDGKFIEETTSAKLNNQLGPFWTLSSVIQNNPELMQSEEGLKLIKDIASQCENSKEKIKSLIKLISKNE